MNFLTRISNFALDGSVSQTGLAKASAAFDFVFTLAGKVIQTVTSNDILLVFFASGLIGIAVSIVRKLKRA